MLTLSVCFWFSYHYLGKSCSAVPSWLIYASTATPVAAIPPATMSVPWSSAGFCAAWWWWWWWMRCCVELSFGNVDIRHVVLAGLVLDCRKTARKARVNTIMIYMLGLNVGFSCRWNRGPPKRYGFSYLVEKYDCPVDYYFITVCFAEENGLCFVIRASHHQRRNIKKFIQKVLAILWKLCMRCLVTEFFRIFDRSPQ